MFTSRSRPAALLFFLDMSFLKEGMCFDILCLDIIMAQTFVLRLFLALRLLRLFFATCDPSV